MKSNVVRFEPGQIWVYDDHKNKKDKKTCNNEKGILIGKRPVLILAISDNIATVIKGSRRTRQEKSHIEYNDGTGIGIFDTLQIETLDLNSADLHYSAKLETYVIKEIFTTITEWLFNYIDDYNEFGFTKFMKKQIWEYNDGGTLKYGVIVKRFKKSVIIVPTSSKKYLNEDIKLDTYYGTLYTDIAKIHTVSTDQLKKYGFTMSEELYSSILTSIIQYLKGESTSTPVEPTIKNKKHSKRHKNITKLRSRKKQVPQQEPTPEKEIEKVIEKPVDKISNKSSMSYCPNAFKHLSFDEMKNEFDSSSISQLANKYKVSVSTVRRARKYIANKLK